MSDRPDIEAYNKASRAINEARDKVSFFKKTLDFTDGVIPTNQAISHLAEICFYQQLAIRELAEAVGQLVPNSKDVEK